ncbi:MAG: hypothetical protein J0L93_06605 [Deltaproteobacteria bacterium]|nr:hypothetical protein [Deltaproteobacteria bacterium]
MHKAFKGIYFFIVLTGFSFSLLAQQGQVNHFGQLSMKNFIENINTAQTPEEVRYVLNHTVFEYKGEFGPVWALSRDFSTRELRSISPLAAAVILKDVYQIDSEKVKAISESKAFTSKWSRFKPAAKIAGVNLAVWAASGASLFVIPTEARIVPILLSIAVPAGSLFMFAPWHWPTRTMGKNLSKETGIEISSADLKAVRALVSACARSTRGY